MTPPRGLLPPLMLVAALGLGLSGALDRPGFEGVGQGLVIGALVCAPIWLFGQLRKRRGDRRD